MYCMLGLGRVLYGKYIKSNIEKINVSRIKEVSCYDNIYRHVVYSKYCQHLFFFFKATSKRLQ